nr:DUF1540 domain-containing protein [uncultured Bacillus sp.]
MPNVEVNCSVSNCAYHSQGNVCGADKIAIEMNFQSKYNSEFAQEFGFTDRSGEASHSAETCCKTFKSKKEE